MNLIYIIIILPKNCDDKHNRATLIQHGYGFCAINIEKI